MKRFLVSLVLGVLLLGCAKNKTATFPEAPARVEAKDEFVCSYHFIDSKAEPSDGVEPKLVRVPVNFYSTPSDRQPIEQADLSQFYGLDFLLSVKPTILTYGAVERDSNLLKRAHIDLSVRESGSDPASHAVFVMISESAMGSGGLFSTVAIAPRKVETVNADRLVVSCGLYNAGPRTGEASGRKVRGG